jgi:GT2 family glycosyltransferase
MSRIRERTIVVIPCYNEASRLQVSAFLDALRLEPLLGFVLVDDGSRDDTYAVLSAIREAAGGRVQLLKLETNSGKAEAVRRGVLRAFEEDARLIGYWDADLATPLAAIADLADVLENRGFCFALGSRVKLLGRRIERDERRHYLGRAFAATATATLGIPVYDTQCGAKLFRATPVLKSAFESPFRRRWTFDVELLGRLIDRELAGRCVEVPLQEWCEKPGSKLRVAHAPGIAWEIASELVRRRVLRRLD